MSLSHEASGNKILEGSWSDNLKWEFYLDSHMPPAELCTAIACVAIAEPSGAIVLTRNQRGWEILGGHIEQDETIEQALTRESLEEGGFQAQGVAQFGYRKVIAREPVHHDQQDSYYPFPVSYIPHFVAVSRLPLLAPTGEEILESRAFNLQEVETLGIKTLPIIQTGVDFYRLMQQ